MSYSTLRAAGHAERKGRVLTGALAITALVAALVALWQTQSTPLARRAYCWGSWPEDGSPFRGGARDRVAEESAPSRGHPAGLCTLRWRAGKGAGEYEQRVELRLGTGPEAAGPRRAWLDGLFEGGDTALPGRLPGFTTAGAGALVLPQGCDVGGRPSVVTLTSSYADATGRGRHPGFPAAASPPDTGALLVRAANRAAAVTGCSSAPPMRMRTRAVPAVPMLPLRVNSDPPQGRCAIPGLGVDDPSSSPSADPSKGSAEDRLTDTVGSVHDDFQTCAIAGDGQWAARFTMVGRPRIVALFDGLTGDSPPAPGWRAHGRIDTDGALIRADCAGRPTVFTMRTGPGRTHTRLDDPRTSFPAFVDAVGERIGCAHLRARG
ncbi:hypothetical protein CTZ27_15580 [Streptomyces griseocarneus]|nr:hypothetical protein CTZ27_15580 [Streptomyces griseocarneus]